jgi:DNA-binding NtrC family response regulator
LDEVDTLPLAAQAKLLHAVEDRRITPIGAARCLPFKARLLVASNRSLQPLVESGHFRADLYYRISVLNLSIPPLRARRTDIGELTDRCLEDIAERHGTSPKRLSPGARAFLLSYSFPGNIRELHNILESAAAFSEGDEITLQDLPDGIRQQPADMPMRMDSYGPGDPETDQGESLSRTHCVTTRPLTHARRSGEAVRIKQALSNNGNNRTRTARELGISRTALYKKLKLYGF